MPNIKSSKKRVLVNEKKNMVNKMVVSSVRTEIKKLNAVIAEGNLSGAEEMYPSVISAIDSAASKGLLHKNNADNKKSILAKRINGLKTAETAE